MTKNTRANRQNGDSRQIPKWKDLFAKQYKKFAKRVVQNRAKEPNKERCSTPEAGVVETRKLVLTPKLRSLWTLDYQQQRNDRLVLAAWKDSQSGRAGKQGNHAPWWKPMALKRVTQDGQLRTDQSVIQ